METTAPCRTIILTDITTEYREDDCMMDSQQKRLFSAKNTIDINELFKQTV